MSKKYPGKVWAGYDIDQAELYMLCLFSKDAALRQALYSKDFHKYVASFLEGIPMEEISKESRELAKTISFQLIYSGFNIEMTKANILKKRRDLNEDKVSEALEKYQENFFCLFNWVKQTALNWVCNEGYLNYFMKAKKFIPVPPYIHPDTDPDKILLSKQGRLAINTYGQNSIGLLLKHIYSKMFENPIIRKNTMQHIPVFDSMSMLVNTKYLDLVIKDINQYATPFLIHDNFNIRMRVSWFLSMKSWGDMKNHKIIISKDLKDEKVVTYEW